MSFSGKDKTLIIRKGSTIYMKAHSVANWSVDGATDEVGYLDQTQTVMKDTEISILDPNNRPDIIGYNVEADFTMLQSSGAAGKEIETLDALRGVDVDIVIKEEGAAVWHIIEDIRMSGNRELAFKPGDNRPIKVVAAAEKNLTEYAADVTIAVVTPFPAA